MRLYPGLKFVEVIYLDFGGYTVLLGGVSRLVCPETRQGRDSSCYPGACYSRLEQVVLFVSPSRAAKETRRL